MRSFVLLVFSCLLLGCRAPMPSLDPFSAGPRRIPPPPTGSIGKPGAPDGYYQPTTVPPAIQRPLNNNLSPVPGYLGTQKNPKNDASNFATAIGSNTSSTDQVIPVVASAAVGTGVRPADSSTAESYSVLVEPAVRVVEPTNGLPEEKDSPAEEPRFTEPRRFNPSQKAIEISSLPKTTSTTQQASSVEAKFKSKKSSANKQFGFQKDYKQLKGQLEYSQTDSRWKLRYIPLDANEKEIDQYGGSVVLGNSSALEGYQTGDFVEIRGRLGKDQPKTLDYSPIYEVEKVERAP